MTIDKISDYCYQDNITKQNNALEKQSCIF